VLVGDLLLSLDDQPISAPDDLLHLLVGDLVGKSTRLGVLRGGTPIALPVTIGERPAS
jgi:S1-C subfamily serine protease